MFAAGVGMRPWQPMCAAHAEEGRPRYERHAFISFLTLPELVCICLLVHALSECFLPILSDIGRITMARMRLKPFILKNGRL